MVINVSSGMIAALDEAIGNITSLMEQKGYFDNMLMIFTSDVSRLLLLLLLLLNLCACVRACVCARAYASDEVSVSVQVSVCNI